MAKVREEDEVAYVAAVGEVVAAALRLAIECPEPGTDDVGSWPVSFSRARALRDAYERVAGYVK